VPRSKHRIAKLNIRPGAGADRKELAEVVRPIYVQLRIIPATAAGIQAAATLNTPPE